MTNPNRENYTLGLYLSQQTNGPNPSLQDCPQPEIQLKKVPNKPTSQIHDISQESLNNSPDDRPTWDPLKHADAETRNRVLITDINQLKKCDPNRLSPYQQSLLAAHDSIPPQEHSPIRQQFPLQRKPQHSEDFQRLFSPEKPYLTTERRKQIILDNDLNNQKYKKWRPFIPEPNTNPKNQNKKS